MAFIGNTPTTQAFTPAIDYFSGNGSTTAFTLSRPVASVAQVQVVIDNVAQNPSSAYTVSSNTITFTSAPLSGTNNIYVYYTSPITQVIAPGQGTVTTAALDVYGSSGTGAENLPSGTTAQRPSSPVAGANRFNTTIGATEYYNGSNWVSLSNYSVNYLLVAGGGSAGGSGSGGGGGGGVLIGATSALIPGTAYTVTVGAGGAASGTAQGASGSNSVFSAIQVNAIGGGAGGKRANGFSGGSAGGGGALGGTYYIGGFGTPSQGGNGGSAGGAQYLSGGGGGAGGFGASATSSSGGNGGVGIQSSISGTTTYYAGGGGGGGQAGSIGSIPGGSGGSGGGGNAGSGNGGAGTSGTANTGGGGGAGVASDADGAGGSGGSGIVIISYAGSQRGTGGTVTTSGGYTIHTFTSSSTYTA